MYLCLGLQFERKSKLFCAAHGLALGSVATPVISDFSFPKAVHLHRGSPLVYAGQHAAEIKRGIRKW
jgi:hypothetical protein